MYALSAELKRSTISFKFIFVILAALFIVVRTLIIEGAFQFENSFFELYVNGFALSNFTQFAVVFAVIPYSASFCNDYNSGYIKHVVTKIGYKEYFKNKALSVGITGALALGIPLILIFTIMLIGARPLAEGDLQIIQHTIWYDTTLYGGIPLFFVGKLFLGLLYGAVWSIIGLAISTWFLNKYLTIIAPFVLNQFFWIIFMKQHLFNPFQMFRGDFERGQFIGSFLYIVLFQIVLLLISILAAYFGFKRSMKNV